MISQLSSDTQSHAFDFTLCTRSIVKALRQACGAGCLFSPGTQRMKTLLEGFATGPNVLDSSVTENHLASMAFVVISKWNGLSSRQFDGYVNESITPSAMTQLDISYVYLFAYKLKISYECLSTHLDPINN